MIVYLKPLILWNGIWPRGIQNCLICDFGIFFCNMCNGIMEKW